jgi:hypothetical protein
VSACQKFQVAIRIRRHGETGVLGSRVHGALSDVRFGGGFQVRYMYRRVRWHVVILVYVFFSFRYSECYAVAHTGIMIA